MPTRDEIPDRHPVIEHMERRLGSLAAVVEPEAPTRPASAGLVGLVAGGGVGGLLLAVFLLYLESRA